MRIGRSVLLIVLFLAGCSDKRHELILNYPGNIRVNETVNACSFVKSVDGIKIEEGMQQGDRIVVSEKLVIGCNSALTPEKLGDYLLEYEINEKKAKTVTLKVIDDLPPIINVRQEEYEVEQGNEYFDIENEVSFSDNYDEKFLCSIDHNINIDETGDYTVRIYAKDSSGNESRKEVPVKVIEKEKIVETIYVSGSGSGHSSSSSSSVQTPASAQTSSGASQQEEKPAAPAPSASPAPEVAPTPSPSGISGVHDISVAVGTDFNSIYFQLSQISASCAVTIDASEVNTSVPGSYTVYYSGSDGSSASATVIVY